MLILREASRASLLLIITALALTSCQFKTPATETPRINDKGEMIPKAFFFRDKKFKPGECSDQTFLVSWAPVTERGIWGEMVNLQGTPRVSHVNVKWCFTQDRLIAYEVNPSFTDMRKNSVAVIEIPIKAQYHYERAKDDYTRDTNKYVKNQDRDAYMFQPMMDLDLQNIQVNPFFNSWFTADEASEAFGVEWDEANQFLGFTVNTKNRLFPAAIQADIRYNFLAINTNPNFEKRPYNPTLAKHMNVLHVVGRTIDGSAQETYAGRWDVKTKPVTFYTYGVPSKYMPIVRDVIKDWNDAFVKAGVVPQGQPALILDERKMDYPFDLRYPVINWNDDKRQGMNAPLGIGFATADVMNGEFKFGSVNVWSGIMEEYINKYAAAEMAYGRMLEGSGSHINRETLFDAEALESSLRPYMEAGGIEGFVRSPEGMKTLKDHLAIMEESNGWLYQAAVDSQPQITPEMKAQVQALRHNQLSYADYSSYIDQDLLNVARTNPTLDMLSVFHNHFSSEIFDAPESLTKEAVASQMSRDQRLTLAAQVAKKEITAIAQASAQDGDRLAAHVVPELILALRDAKAGDPNIDETRILHTALKSLLSHELGHVLGLGHNFKGNQMPIKGTVADDDYHAAQEQYATKGYVRSTVMDYTSPKAEVKMAYEDMIPGPYDIQVLRYLYNGEYPVIAADGKTKRYIKIAANGVVPDKTEDPQTGEALTAGFLPACNDIEASLNFNPYCQRHDRGHNAVEMVTTRFKDLNASLSAQLNAFSNAKGGNAGLKKYYLWSRLLREFGQVRVFYDYMRVLLDEQPEYRDAFARIRRSQDALIAFSEACIDPNKAPAGFERAFAQLALRDPSKLGTPVTALKEEDFTEVRDLCAANAIALNQWGDLMRRKGSDYTTYDRQFRYTTSGIFGGEYDGDWSYLWGAYQELGAFPVRLTTLMTVTNPFPYFLWGGIIPNPIYANNQGMYSYAPLYPKEFGMVIDTTVRENLNLGGGPNNENTEIGSTLMYTYYFMARNRIYTKDNDNRFPAIYLENLNGLTSFEIKVSPIIMTNVNKEGAPDSQVFGYQASYLDMAKYEAVSIPYAYLLTDRRVIAQGNAKQVFLPFTKFRYLTDKWGYVWALDLRYHHKEDDPLKGFSVKNGLNLMAQKQIETCAQGATGLSSFFNMTNQDFKGFKAPTGIAVREHLQPDFDDSVKAAYADYYKQDFGGGRRAQTAACEDAIKSLNVIVGGAALINGFWLPQAIQYLNF